MGTDDHRTCEVNTPEENPPEPDSPIGHPSRLPLPLLALCLLALIHAARWAIVFVDGPSRVAGLTHPGITFERWFPRAGALSAAAAVLGIIGVMTRRRWGLTAFILSWCALYLIKDASNWLLGLAVEHRRHSGFGYAEGFERVAPAIWTAVVVSYLWSLRRAAGASEEARSPYGRLASAPTPLPLTLNLLAVYAAALGAFWMMYVGQHWQLARGDLARMFSYWQGSGETTRGTMLTALFGILGAAAIFMHWRWGRAVLFAWACGLALFEGCAWFRVGYGHEPWLSLPLWLQWWGVLVAAATGLFHVSYLCSPVVRRTLAKPEPPPENMQ